MVQMRCNPKTMSYRLAKWLFPKMRPDQCLKRLNTIILVILFVLGSAALLVAIMLVTYYHIDR